MAQATKEASIGSIEFLDQPDDEKQNKSWLFLPLVVLAIAASAFFIVRRASRKSR